MKMAKRGMGLSLDDLTSGVRINGLVIGIDVEIIAVERHGESIANVVYRDDKGNIAQRLVNEADLGRLSVASAERWTFDAPGSPFKLASEARRIQLAHLFDPFAAVSDSTIDPLPHQIEAVYQRLLPLQPCHFLLADDPGAGKTIMSGLYIRELIIRGDLERCLIVAPGSLVEQWQDELNDKFGLRFDILSRDMVEAARSGNPFNERNLLIARLDQLSRNEDLKARLQVSDWDLVIFDEAHKLSAHRYVDEVKRTQRFALAEMVRERTRNLLLLTATPHNGNNEDFLLFMTLIDSDRFTGRLGGEAAIPDISDLMRRYVKENLKTFEGTRLFPPRIATTVNYDLSPEEETLYEAVTSYVQEGMNRAKKLEENKGNDKRRGMAIGFALAALQRRLASSPEAILRSLERRHNKIEAQITLARKAGRNQLVAQLPKNIDDPDGFDSDDYDDEELERLENEAIENAFSAESIVEMEREVNELKVLIGEAQKVHASGNDKKWLELRNILLGDEFRDADGDRKLIVFTEHRDTLNYLYAKACTVLGNQAVVTIHGGLRRDDRRRIQDAFRNERPVKVLIATDAAGEGVNLQRANLMVNYDLPWNPNRIEQRFGRIHRIGQKQTCHLWNLVAHETREGKVFERLFAKIEEQKNVYGEQIYDVLGDAEINRSLQELLMRAIQADKAPDAMKWIDEVIDAEIGQRMRAVLEDEALDHTVLDDNGIVSIRRQMEAALARKLAPGFIQAFVVAALEDQGGRMAQREAGRFEVVRVPATVRARNNEIAVGAPIANSYERVTFDKRRINLEGSPIRADLVTPGHPLLGGLIHTILDKYSSHLSSGTTFVDSGDAGIEPRVLVYLEHTVSDGRMEVGQRKVVSRRFQFVEMNGDGTISDPGAEPYLQYDPITPEARALLANVDLDWAATGISETARGWAVANLATPHFDEVATIAKARIARVRQAVVDRLNFEIRYWDARAAELKAKELQGKQGNLNSGRARQRADDLEARRDKRLRELDAESDLVNHAPTVVAAALVIPQGLLDRLTGVTSAAEIDPQVAQETDRVAVEAVMAAERNLGREPEEQVHNNPGYDILSIDPRTNISYFIEVKGHRPNNDEIKVRARQIRMAKMNPERFRLAVVSVTAGDSPVASQVRYLVRPFDDYEPHFAQTYVPLNVQTLLELSVEPM